MQIREVPIHQLSPGEQPRHSVNPVKLSEMERSLSDDGQINPIHITEDGMVICGNTRLQAAKNIGWKTIQARVWPNNTTPQEIFRLSVVENTVRTQMNFAEKADALLRGAEEMNVTPAEAGKLLGIDQSTVSKLLSAVDTLTNEQVKGILKAKNGKGGSLAYYVAQGEDEAERHYLYEQVVTHKWTRKQLEIYFTEKRTKVTKANFKLGDAQISAIVPRGSASTDIVDVLNKLVKFLKSQPATLSLNTLTAMTQENHLE